MQGAPQNTVIGGASLWVMSGKKADEYKGVAAFFSHLSKVDVAAASHQRTGYLPVTLPSFEATDKSGFYKQNPGTDVSVTQMIRKTTEKSRGHSPRQLAADPHHHRRRDGEHLERQENRE